MKKFLMMITMIIIGTGCGNIGDFPESTLTRQPITQTEMYITQEVSATPQSDQPTTLQSPNLATLEPNPLILELKNLIQIAENDLADRISIEPDQIELINLTEATWQDTSLDCPQPGVVYTQVINQGYSIILQAMDILYEYYTDSNNLVIFCRSGATLPGKIEGAVQDGWPSQPKDGDVIIIEPTETK